jgi:hypothetical protein
MQKTTKFEWNNEAQLAFEKLKQQFLERPILQMVDQEKPFELECDASAFCYSDAGPSSKLVHYVTLNARVQQA